MNDEAKAPAGATSVLVRPASGRTLGLNTADDGGRGQNRPTHVAAMPTVTQEAQLLWWLCDVWRCVHAWGGAAARKPRAGVGCAPPAASSRACLCTFVRVVWEGVECPPRLWRPE